MSDATRSAGRCRYPKGRGRSEMGDGAAGTAVYIVAGQRISDFGTQSDALARISQDCVSQHRTRVIASRFSNRLKLAR